MPVIEAALEALAARRNAELMWASSRELFNVFQTGCVGCHAITVSAALLEKLSLVGKDLDALSLETVRDFSRDARASGLTIVPPTDR